MRFWRVFAVVVVAGLLTVVGAGPASADEGSSWRITRFHQDVQLAADGTATVALTLDFDFGNEPGHGPMLYLPLRQRTADPDQWLVLGFEMVSATSSSGANADVQVDRGDDVAEVRIGRKGTRFTGVQTYVVTYRLTGLVAQNHEQSRLDEFNWNAIGSGWQVPIASPTVTLTGPAAVSRVGCFYGAGESSYTQPCQADRDGATAQFAGPNLRAGTPMQVTAGFPAGTFTGTTQTFTKRYWVGNMFPLTPATGIGTALLTLGGYAFVYRRARRANADEVYLGMTPGLSPGRGQTATVGKQRKAPPVAVQFQPPEGARPGELGTLLDASADNVDVTATILDLAVRGYLVISPRGDDGNHVFSLTDKPFNDLRTYERGLLTTMFQSKDVVTLNQLRKPKYAPLLPDARKGLYDRVLELGWFRGRPEMRLATVIVVAGIVAFAGVVIGGIGALFGWGILGLAGIIVAVLIAANARKFTARTAEGSAMLAQTKGFELYLSTAEAKQIKFEEGIDVFSRYLPYAVIFGVTERWVKVFKELEQAGVYVPDTTWYGGMNFHLFNAWGFSNAMNGLTHSMSSSMISAATASTSGSMGGSGFSGGGGFGGGGGGGW